MNQHKTLFKTELNVVISTLGSKNIYFSFLSLLFRRLFVLYKAILQSTTLKVVKMLIDDCVNIFGSTDYIYCSLES